MLFIINSFILSILFLKYNTNIIVLPFRENKPNLNFNLSNEFYSKELYTEVLIGDPPQHLVININPENYLYYIQPFLCYENIQSYYNHSLSRTFHEITEICEDITDEYNDGLYASDFFSFYNSTDLQTNLLLYKKI